jgi:hypothetical protein
MNLQFAAAARFYFMLSSIAVHKELADAASDIERFNHIVITAKFT